MFVYESVIYIWGDFQNNTLKDIPTSMYYTYFDENEEGKIVFKIKMRIVRGPTCSILSYLELEVIWFHLAECLSYTSKIEIVL